MAKKAWLHFIAEVLSAELSWQRKVSPLTRWRSRKVTKRGLITIGIIAVLTLVIEPIMEKGLKEYIEDVADAVCVIGIIRLAIWWFTGK